MKQIKSPQTVTETNRGTETIVIDLNPLDYTDGSLTYPVGTYLTNYYTSDFQTYIGRYIVGSGNIPARDLAMVQKLEQYKGVGRSLSASDQIALGNGRIRTPLFGESNWLNADNIKESNDSYATTALIETDLISSINPDDWVNTKPINYYPDVPYRIPFTSWCQTWTLKQYSAIPPIVLAEIDKMNVAKGSDITVFDLIRLQRRQILCPTFSKTSHYIKATNYGFTIPIGATITSIKVEIEQKGEFYKTSPLIMSNDYEIKLIYPDGSVGTVNKTLNEYSPTVELYQSYPRVGGQWDRPLTAEDVNNSNFGVAFSVKGIGTVSVDHIRMSVEYITEPILTPCFFK